MGVKNQNDKISTIRKDQNTYFQFKTKKSLEIPNSNLIFVSFSFVIIVMFCFFD